MIILLAIYNYLTEFKTIYLFSYALRGIILMAFMITILEG